VYDKGEKNNKLRLFEILILDYNLNVLLSKKFTSKIKISSYGCYFDNFGKLILYPYYSEETDYITDQYQLDLTNNTLEEYTGECLILNQIKPCIVKYNSKGIKNKRDGEINTNGFYIESNVYTLVDKQYLLTKTKNIKAHEKIFDGIFEILKFDKDKILLWKYEDDSPKVKDVYHSMIMLFQDTSTICYMRMNYLKSKFKSVDFISLDSKTGKKLNSINHSSFTEETYYSLVSLMSGNKVYYIDGNKRIDNKVYFIGSIIEKRNSNYINYGDVGFVKMIYDIPSGQFTFQQFNFLDIKNQFPTIDKYGHVGDYDLSLVAVYPFADGNDIFIFEKFKYSPNYWSGVVKGVVDDFVLITTDSSFVPKKFNVIRKQITKGFFSEYLYGQYLNDNKDLVFFYYDEITEEGKKNKDYKLYINKIINGEYSQDNILISSKDNVVIPKIAKRGYILLREYNKESKYNQIRLEKLNF
jgi:hypothetical protein